MLWTLASAFVAAGLVLWVVTGRLGGRPGPVVSGVWAVGWDGFTVVASYALTTWTLASVGAAMASRVTHNVIGWILLALAAWLGFTLFIGVLLHMLGSEDPAFARWANWIGVWAFVPVIFLPPTLVVLLFPEGRLLSSRWRTVAWLAVVTTAGWAVLEATSPYLGVARQIPNPFAHPQVNAVANLVTLLGVPALLGAVASLVVRFRRSSPEVRQQIRWVVFGGVLEVTVLMVVWAWSALRPAAFGAVAIAVGIVTTSLIPAAIGVAILKYRLYGLDRLLSRTVAYGVLALLLGAVYAGSVIGVQALLPASGSLAVAASTLAVAALFAPFRRRVQGAVDRRFNRAQYDALLVADNFTRRLRSITRIDTLMADLSRTLCLTLEPSSIAIWLKNGSGESQAKRTEPPVTV